MLGLELATALAANGFGTVNTSIFYNDVPPDPDTLIAILQYGGEADEPDLGINGKLTRYETIRFQLLTRGAQRDSDGPQWLCYQAKVYLLTILNATISGVYYVGIDCLTPPAKLKMDETFRTYWICNLKAIKAPSAS